MPGTRRVPDISPQDNLPVTVDKGLFCFYSMPMTKNKVEFWVKQNSKKAKLQNEK